MTARIGLFGLLILASDSATAQSGLSVPAEGHQQRMEREETSFPTAVRDTLKMLNVKDSDLRDVFRGIAFEHEINLIVDNHIQRKVTFRLANLPVIEVLTFLCEENGLILTYSQGIFRIQNPPERPPPTPDPPLISLHDSLLSVDLRGAELETVVHEIARQSGINIVIRQGVRGSVTGLLKNVPLVVGLRTLAGNNGFSVRNIDDIYHIDRAGMRREDSTGEASTFWIQVEKGLVTLDIVNGKIADVLREIGVQMKVNLITYAVPENVLSAKVSDLTFEESLNFLLKGTNITYRQEGDVYYVGSKQTNGIASTRLLSLNHIRADAVLDLVPDVIKEQANIRVVKEHNGLMITGTNDVIAELENFVRVVDYPTPQIHIEALVVDFEANDLFELGLQFGRDEATSSVAGQDGYLFQSSGDNPGLHHSLDGRQANDLIEGVERLTGLFGIRKIGRLPGDFFLKLHALSQEGKAHIRSRPQIATLNGHTASISIGTTQYYILRTNTPYQSPAQLYLQESERFEKIEANVKLEITPWVSASGEVTAEIRPEFSTPVGELDPLIPPTINSRVLDSTVRLKDGETIILGGLIQEVDAVTYNKIPILGNLPWIGKLFSGRSHEKKKSELVIFLTPHVFYGDEQDREKWQLLQDQLEFSPANFESNTSSE